MPDTVQDLIRKAATEAGVPPALALAVAEQESGFNPTVLGPEITVGGRKIQAVGTFQLLPTTAQMLGVDPMDPRQNITGGVKYLRQLLDTHQGDLDKVLRAYGGVVRDQTYVPGVLQRLAKFQTAAAPPPLPAQATAGMIPPSTAAGDPEAAVAAADPLLALRHAEAIGAAPPWWAEYDPRTFRGRVNLAGMAGGVVAGVATRNPYVGAGVRTGVQATATSAVRTGIAPWIIRVLGPPAAAGVAGGGEAALEAGLGTEGAQRRAVAGATPLEAGVEQASYEAFGQLVWWPLRRLGSSLIAPRVVRRAETALTTGIKRARESGQVAVDLVRDRTREALDALTVFRAAPLEARGRLAGPLRQAAAEAGAAGAARTERALGQFADRELQAVADLADLAKQYDNLLAQPPSLIAAGQRGVAALAPAKRALDATGQRVQEAAESGPELNFQPVIESLRAQTRRAKPTSIFQPPQEATGIGFLRNVAGVRGATAGGATALEQSRFSQLIAEQLQRAPTERLPLSDILDLIARGPTRLSFRDAHAVKLLLDERVSWDRPAKAINERLTKATRTTLRDVMSVHEPYNVATAAYDAIIDLYRRGIGRRVHQLARTPQGVDQIARSLKLDNPAEALALKELIVTQAAAGGEVAVGRQAWDSIRDVFTYQHVIDGKLDGLAERVQRLVTQHREFTRIVYDDVPGQKVLTNLDTLGRAVKRVTAAAEEQHVVGGVAAQTAWARDLVATKRLVQQTVQQHTELRDLFRGEVPRLYSLEMRIADLIRGLGLGPFQVWGAMSWVRLLHGPNGPELVRWAAYSDRNTQRAVGLLQGTWPERVVAAGTRGTGVGEPVGTEIVNFFREMAGFLSASPAALTAPTEPVGVTP